MVTQDNIWPLMMTELKGMLVLIVYEIGGHFDDLRYNLQVISLEKAKLFLRP